MASTATYNCLCCRQPFTARTADRKCGWARYCSKSCKAIKQVQKGGKYLNYQRSQSDDWHTYAMDAMEEGWDGHKVWTS